MPDYFSVPIFFIVFRETIEAAIIVGVLLSFVEQLMTTGRRSQRNEVEDSTLPALQQGVSLDEADRKSTEKLLKRMRLQIWAGTLAGFFLALCIGAAFIAVFYTKVVDLWAKTEQIWEGVFSAVASVIIMIMGIAFLKMDKSRVKWRLKLADAFEKSHSKAMGASDAQESRVQREEGRSGKWALFLLPFITVVREGLEAVVFVGGVSLGIPAVSIPIAVIVGLIAGAIVGYLIYKTGTTTTLHWFLVGSTTILFLIGAGLFSKAIGYFEYYTFAKGVGGDVAETGDGPGSFRVAGNVWHLTYGNPETGSPTTNGGWQIFNAILGWNNSASIGTILGYVFYWLFLIGVLLYLKWQEGRLSFRGKGSAAYNRRMGKRATSGGSPETESGSFDPDETPSEEKKDKDLVPQ